MDGIDLQFENDVLDFIVEKAIEFKLGARGLRSICEAIMMDVMFDMPSKKDKEITITLEYAKEKLGKTNITKAQSSLINVSFKFFKS